MKRIATPSRTPMVKWGILIVIIVAAGGLLMKDRFVHADPEKHAEAGRTSSNAAEAPDHHEPRNQAPAKSPRNWTEGTLSVKDLNELWHSDMTPQLARVLLDKAKDDVKNIPEKASLSAAILFALCNHGYTQEAWELIDPNPGTIHTMEIGGMFQYDKGPIKSLIDRLSGLTELTDRVEALRSIVSSRPAEIASLDFSHISLDSAPEKANVTGCIQTAINGQDGAPKDPATSQALFLKALDLLTEQKLTVDNLVSLLRFDRTNDPFQQWQALDGLKSGVSGGDLEHLRVAVVPRLMEADPEKALETICSNDASKYSMPVLSMAVDMLFKNDPQQAADWMSNHLSSVDPATGQRIIVGVAHVAIRNGEYDTAEQWASQLVNVDVRQDVIDQIESYRHPKAPGK